MIIIIKVFTTFQICNFTLLFYECITLSCHFATCSLIIFTLEMMYLLFIFWIIVQFFTTCIFIFSKVIQVQTT